MAPRYRITLTLEERQELEVIFKTGRRAAKTILHARALLLLDVGEFGQHWTVKKTAEAIGLSTRSLEHLKQRFVDHNYGKSIHTIKYKPWKLEAYFAFSEKSKAVKFEKYLKSGSGRTFSKKHF